MIQNQEGSGGYNYGGLAIMADKQAHIRFQVSNSDDWGGSGAKRWQIRCGQASGADRLGVYSWTAASDLHLWDSSGNQHNSNGNHNHPTESTIIPTEITRRPTGITRIPTESQCDQRNSPTHQRKSQ